MKFTCQKCKKSFKSKSAPSKCPFCKQEFLKQSSGREDVEVGSDPDLDLHDLDFPEQSSELSEEHFDLPEPEVTVGAGSDSIRESLHEFDFDDDDDGIELSEYDLGIESPEEDSEPVSPMDSDLPNPEITVDSDLPEPEVTIDEADLETPKTVREETIREEDPEHNTPTIKHSKTITDTEQTLAAPSGEAHSRRKVAAEKQKEQARASSYPMNDVDPMATLGAGVKDGVSAEATAQTDSAIFNKLTDSALEFDLHEAVTIEDVTQTKTPPESEQSRDNKETLKTEDPELKGTVINPNAAQDAAENYSRGLNTVIPPRTVSRIDEPGKLQDYKVEKRLGAGAFGVVFKAVQVPLDRHVAVKVLQVEQKTSDARTEALKNEFLREAQFTGRLEHPNIVPIHDIGLTINQNGQVSPFYVMKEIVGESWHKTIRKKSRAQNLDVFKRVTNAIGFAHDKDILHCDLKPENVMLGEFGEVLVVDWGQAVDLSRPETMRAGGTPAYISPEMAQYWCDIYLNRKSDSPARKLVGYRSDVYLLGALLFEIIARRPPHLKDPNESPYEVIRAAAENEIVDHSKYRNDELMKIALNTLRVGDGEPIETVEHLLAEIEAYENRLLSIELRYRADEILSKAKTDDDYDDFQRARFGYEESLEKWDGNEASRNGLRDAQLSCARLALKDQNFDLGIGMLENPQTSDEKELKNQLVTGRSKRDRRKKLVRYLALGLASSIIVGIGVNAFMD